MLMQGCCCGTKIGYDDTQTIRSVEAINPACGYNIPVCLTTDIILNIASDVSRLGECKVVYAGHRPGGGMRKTVIFDPADWPAVRAYIEGGGRLVLSGESELSDATTEDSTTTNSFLTAMGSAMQWAGGHYEQFDPFGLCQQQDSGLSGAANIASGLPPNPIFPPGTDIFFGGSAAVSGGTSVFTGQVSGQILMAVEQLGSGFLFFNADNHIYNVCCFLSSCTFFNRLYSYADADII